MGVVVTYLLTNEGKSYLHNEIVVKALVLQPMAGYFKCTEVDFREKHTMQCVELYDGVMLKDYKGDCIATFTKRGEVFCVDVGQCKLDKLLKIASLT